MTCSPLQRTLFAALAALVAAGAVACKDTSDSVVTPPVRYVTAFSDEFDGPAGTVPSADRWVFDEGTAVNGWGNAELQYYTARASNASLDGDGNLVITARRESFNGRDYTSARLKTRDRFEQQYGLFEARIKLPGGRGIWPAFWMLGNDCEGDICEAGAVTWPAVGEIDVVELFGSETDKVSTSLHGPGYSGGAALTGSHRLDGGADFTEDFHIFAVEWDPSTVRWFIDGQLVQTMTVDDAVTARGGEWVFDHPFFMLLNVAVGGLPVGAPDASTEFPARMVVDYVRVFQRNER